MNKIKTVIFKTCKCSKGSTQTFIMESKYKVWSKCLSKCKNCDTIIFPNNFNNCVWTYSDNEKTLSFEISDIKKGRCYLYEEEKL